MSDDAMNADSFHVLKAEAEARDERGTPHTRGNYMGDVIRERLARRGFLKGAGALGVGMVLAGAVESATGTSERTAAAADFRVSQAKSPSDWLQFQTVPPSNADEIVIPPGYAYNLLLRWGDQLFVDSPAFDFNNQTGAAQARQFGFNCDYIGYFPLPFLLKTYLPDYCQKQFPGLALALGLLGRDRRGLLAVNHEYTSGEEMIPGYLAMLNAAVAGDPAALDALEEFVQVELAAHGMSIVEVRRESDGEWTYSRHSRFNRRITGTTPMMITGPLAGHELLQTSTDSTGRWVHGMLNNCAGGKTPWGTVLTCEENFDQYFANFNALKTLATNGQADPRTVSYNTRIAPNSGASFRRWEKFHDRFDVSKEPNEYARFGYVVEIDPFDPNCVPKKRTALGRFKHEGATTAVAKDGRVAVYSGDDARFEYVYKFVTDGRFNPNNRSANMDLLDHGTLYAAKFNADGTGEWLPLTPANVEQLLNTRGLADAAGATAMDRPEDIEVSPATGKVYIILTNNTARTSGNVNAANPRGPNRWGHVIELVETNDDAGATTFDWQIFILCGDPADPTDQAMFGDIADPVAAGVSPIAAPDNLVFDNQGNMWIATDGQPNVQGFGQNDGVFAVPTEGADRGLLRQFLSGIPGGEVCGPEFTPDNRSFFCGIQHPGEGSGLPNSVSAWPDGANPPKPSVIAVRHLANRPIGAGVQTGAVSASDE